MTALNSLQALSIDRENIEWLVQDDASPALFLPALIPNAATARNVNNLGFAGNCNAGAKRAAGDVLLFVNQDVYGVPEFSHGWDEALRAAFTDPRVGIVGARLLFPDGRIQSAGGLFDAKAQPYHRCLGYKNPQYWEVGEERTVEWVTGAALAIRRDLFERLGGFDEGYRMYFEDVDLCLQAKEAGYLTLYAPSVTLIHKVGSTGGSPYFAASAARFRVKWLESGKLRPGGRAVYASFW
jgi:GT2 family glycosyltransferase